MAPPRRTDDEDDNVPVIEGMPALVPHDMPELVYDDMPDLVHDDDTSGFVHDEDVPHIVPLAVWHYTVGHASTGGAVQAWTPLSAMDSVD